MTPKQKLKSVQRVRILAGNAEVQERGLLKYARITRSISSALVARGIDELAARLGAEFALLAFRVALERWMASTTDEPFSRFADEAMRDLTMRTLELDQTFR